MNYKFQGFSPIAACIAVGLLGAIIAMKAFWLGFALVAGAAIYAFVLIKKTNL
jgi:hypothetical protein